MNGIPARFAASPSQTVSPTSTACRVAARSSAASTTSGSGFGRRDVLLRHGHRAQALEAEDAEKGIGMACDRRRGQHHGEPLAFEAVRHFTRTIEAADLGEDRVEALLPRCAHRIAEVALDPGAGDGGDELVASHADVAVKAPHGNVEVVIAKGARPWRSRGGTPCRRAFRRCRGGPLACCLPTSSEPAHDAGASGSAGRLRSRWLNGLRRASFHSSPWHIGHAGTIPKVTTPYPQPRQR